MGEAVADHPLGRQRTLRGEYQFDRLGAEKLAQVYACLVPDPMQLPGRGARPTAREPSGGSE